MPTSGQRTQSGQEGFPSGQQGSHWPFRMPASWQGNRRAPVSKADTVLCRSRAGSPQKQVSVTNDNGDHEGGKESERGRSKQGDLITWSGRASWKK